MPQRIFPLHHHDRGRDVMRTSDILLIYKTMSAEDKRAFDRRIKASAVIGSILVAGLIAMALVGSNSVRRGHAITHSTNVPQFSAAEKRSEDRTDHGACFDPAIERALVLSRHS